MNARGLMELIIINIGLQRGIISPGLFATLVIMAIVTTLMASPIFDRLVGKGFTAEPLPYDSGHDPAASLQARP
jgi:Kef-type K+ transport system membrane component KefB